MTGSLIFRLVKYHKLVFDSTYEVRYRVDAAIETGLAVLSWTTWKENFVSLEQAKEYIDTCRAHQLALENRPADEVLDY